MVSGEGVDLDRDVTDLVHVCRYLLVRGRTGGLNGGLASEERVTATGRERRLRWRSRTLAGGKRREGVG